MILKFYSPEEPLHESVRVKRILELKEWILTEMCFSRDLLIRGTIDQSSRKKFLWLRKVQFRQIKRIRAMAFLSF